MVKDKLSWKEVCGRAQSVKKVAAAGDRKVEEKEQEYLIKYLTENAGKA